MARKPKIADVEAPKKSNQTDIEAAYQKLLIEHQQLKQAYDAIIHTSPDPQRLPPAGIPTETFEANGSNYQMAAANLNIVGIGKRTALECMVDDTLYPHLAHRTILQWMVDNNSTAVKKVS